MIQGAAQGIGRSAALQFAKEGAKVIVSDLDHRQSRQRTHRQQPTANAPAPQSVTEKAQAVVDEIKGFGGEAHAVSGDGMLSAWKPPKVHTADASSATVTKAEFPKHLITETVKKYGKINHIVNKCARTTVRADL